MQVDNLATRHGVTKQFRVNRKYSAYQGSRGLITGGAPNRDTRNMISIATSGNATDFGEMDAARSYQNNYMSDGIRGDGCGGGNETKSTDIYMETFTTSTTGVDFGDLSQDTMGSGSVSDGSRGVTHTGDAGPDPTNDDNVDYIRIATRGNGVSFTELTLAKNGTQGASNGHRGLFGGAKKPPYSPIYLNDIDYLTIGTLSDALDFGDKVVKMWGAASSSTPSRAVWGGGNDPIVDSIDYVSIGTAGNCTDFGNLTQARYILGGLGDGFRNLWVGGHPPELDTIDYVMIDTAPGNATDFGNMVSGCYGPTGTSGI